MLFQKTKNYSKNQNINKIKDLKKRLIELKFKLVYLSDFEAIYKLSIDRLDFYVNILNNNIFSIEVGSLVIKKEENIKFGFRVLKTALKLEQAI
jgi:IS4 transposase